MVPLKAKLKDRLNQIFYVGLSLTTLRADKCTNHASQSVYTRRSEMDANGASRKVNLRPRAKRYTSETLPDRDLLILGLLTVWRADIWWYHDCLTEDVVSGIFASCVSIYVSPADPAVRWSLGRTFRYFIESVVQCPIDNPKWPLLLKWVTEVGCVGLPSCDIEHRS